MCELRSTPNPHPVFCLTRFVKERRPSISPNFNFLGQLQHFQGALSQKASGGDFIQQLDNRLPSINHHSQSSHNSNCQATVSTDTADSEHSAHNKDQTQHKDSLSDTSGNQQQKLWTLNLNQQQQVQTSCHETSPSTPCEPIKPARKPTLQLQLPSGSASLAEKRKSLSLSLTPLGMSPPSPTSSNQESRETTSSKNVHSRETGERLEAKTPSNTGSCGQAAEVKEQGLLSPFSFTLNKLLDWGERVLLGGVFVHNVRLGQPALPYRCWE